jgi:glycosyltransferase involved in cell wall biosynthesis
MRQLLPTTFYPGRKRVGANLTQLEYAPTVKVFDGIDWYWLPSMVRALVFLAQERPDEVVLQWWTGTVFHSYLLIAVVAKLLGANVIVEFHEVLDTGEAKLLIARLYVRFIAPFIVRLASGFVIHSEYDRELLMRHYNLEKRLITLIPHGPYYHHATACEQKFPNTDTSCYNLLFFGVIRPYKGLEDLILAFDALPKHVADTYQITIVGETWEGWDKPKMLIEQSQYRNRITFVNRYVTDSELVQFFEEAHAVVLPYHRSSTSGPLHIAMSYGLPVVVTKVGGLVEAVRNYEGAILVEPENAGELQNALLQVVHLCGKRYRNPRSWEHTNSGYSALFDACEGENISAPSVVKEVSLSAHHRSQRELANKH